MDLDLYMVQGQLLVLSKLSEIIKLLNWINDTKVLVVHSPV